jgi:hypothetical protein
VAGYPGHELSRPDQILTRKPLIWLTDWVRPWGQTAYARLRHTIAKAKMFVTAPRTGSGFSQCGIHDFYCGSQQTKQLVALHYYDGSMGAGTQEDPVDTVGETNPGIQAGRGGSFNIAIVFW